MKKSKFSEEQIAYVLRQVEAGVPIADVCRQVGVREATFYIWKKKYAHLGVAELRQMRQLEAENAQLKLVADLSLDKHIFRKPCEKKAEAHTAPRARRVGPGDLPRVLRAGLSLGALQSGRVVSTQPGQRSNRLAAASPRARARAAAVRLPADLGAPPAGGLAREYETGPPLVPPRGATAPHAGAAPQAHRAAPRTGAGPHRPDGALEHGFCPRCAGRRTAVSRAHRSGSLESPESDPRSGLQHVRDLFDRCEVVSERELCYCRENDW
jgi:putative transposase